MFRNQHKFQKNIPETSPNNSMSPRSKIRHKHVLEVVEAQSFVSEFFVPVDIFGHDMIVGREAALPLPRGGLTLYVFLPRSCCAYPTRLGRRATPRKQQQQHDTVVQGPPCHHRAQGSSVNPFGYPPLSDMYNMYMYMYMYMIKCKI